MRRFLALYALFLCIVSGSAACVSPEDDPANWHSCRDVGVALANRVDDCLKEVNEQISYIDEKGDFFTLWNDFKVCEAFGEVSGKKIERDMLENLRECGAWLLDLSCDDVGVKLRRIITYPRAKDIGQPLGCNPLVQQLQKKFGK